MSFIRSIQSIAQYIAQVIDKKMPVRPFRHKLSHHFFSTTDTIRTICAENRSWTIGGISIFAALIILKIAQKVRDANQRSTDISSLPGHGPSMVSDQKEFAPPGASLDSAPPVKVLLYEADPRQLANFDTRFRQIAIQWQTILHCRDIQLEDEENIDDQLQRLATSVLDSVDCLMRDLLGYANELHRLNNHSATEDPAYMDAEVGQRYIKAMQIAENLRLAASGNELNSNFEALSTVPPGGVDNGVGGSNNFCFIAVVLHMLRIGYRSRLDAAVDSRLQEIARMVAALSEGVEITANAMTEFAQKLRDWGIIGNENDGQPVPPGPQRQACALELFQGFLNFMNAPQVGMERAVQQGNGDWVAGPDTPLTLDFALQIGSKDSLASPQTLNQAVAGEFHGGDQRGQLVPNSLPEILPISFKRASFIAANAASEEIEFSFSKNGALTDSQFEEFLQKSAQQCKVGAVKLNDEVAVSDVWVIPRQFIRGNGSTIIYQLKGFVYHDGSESGNGHYIAFTHQAGTWFECNDRDVHPAEPEWRKNCQNKALFYIYKSVS